MRGLDGLTPRQEEIVRCARRWVAEYGEAPSVRELGEAVGLSSSGSITYQLRRMREAGVVVETRGRRSDRCPHCGR
ncbi:LexA family protein [Streptomyces sp. NPDC001691]|uniref:LexA family protein n=1 Tax=Streptomyces sp. NPDC001691 TaxID=3364600 RepID=UPI0036C479FD